MKKLKFNGEQHGGSWTKIKGWIYHQIGHCLIWDYCQNSLECLPIASFLSFPRHEYFRRLLCNMIGSDIENGMLPNDKGFFKKR